MDGRTYCAFDRTWHSPEPWWYSAVRNQLLTSFQNVALKGVVTV